MFRFYISTIFISLGLLVGSFSTPVFAAATGNGCDPAVAEAHKAIANAKVANDVAVTEELMDKPESVLAMTCFEKGAKVSAEAGGSIFSGDFSDKLQQVLDKGLEIHYNNYSDGTASARYNLLDGGMSGLYDSLMSSVSINFDIGFGPGSSGASSEASFDCNNMNDLWQAGMNEGISTEIPTLSFEDLISGALPSSGVGKDFKTSHDASFGNNNKIAERLNNAIDNLPVPDIPDLSSTKSVCDVLSAIGITGCAP